MPSIRFILLLLLCWTVEAQLPVVPLQTTPVAGFNPKSVSHAALFLNYLDLPLTGRPGTWTNEIIPSNIWTNQGASIPTNSPSGMYFDGTAGNFFKNSTSTISMSNQVDSTWFCVTIISFNHVFDMILGTSNNGGHGFTASTAVTGGGNGFEWVASSANPMSKAVTNVQYDVAQPANANTAQLQARTNGVATGLNWTMTLGTSETLWGVGQDNGGDNNAHMYLKFVLICTNYTFTAQDIANLHTYALTH